MRTFQRQNMRMAGWLCKECVSPHKKVMKTVTQISMNTLTMFIQMLCY